MKKNLLLIAAIFCMAASTSATTYTVSVGGMSFTPSTLTVHVGDVITWMWHDGTHTTQSTSVPGGAATWNSNMDATTTTFSYTPTVVGTYSYKCLYHASMGMVGTITVLAPASVAAVSTAPVFTVFPNPVSGRLHIVLNDPMAPTTVTLVSLTGVEIMNKVYSGTKETDLDLQDVPNGLYFIRAVQDGNATRQQLTIVH